MPSDTGDLLQPRQVCWVVDDVPAAVRHCEQAYGWGPFFQFRAEIEDASYKQWRGAKDTEVALGMAGDVQVEFLCVHKGCDTTADYQAEYGCGLQHLGVHCQSREAALSHLEALGATVNELNEFPGVRFAFVDTPTGPGMFEILQATQAADADPGLKDSTKGQAEAPVLHVDRATVVTNDMAAALAFYRGAFGWSDVNASQQTLRSESAEVPMLRCIARAGTLDIELIQPLADGDDPYSRHLQRGAHGLVHAGGISNQTEQLDAASYRGTWLETNETFSLLDWEGGNNSLQLRHPTS